MAALLDPTSNEQKYSKINSAVIIGATSADSTRLWVRVYQEGRWTLVISTAPLVGDLVRLEEKSIPDFLAVTHGTCGVIAGPRHGKGITIGFETFFQSCEIAYKHDIDIGTYTTTNCITNIFVLCNHLCRIQSARCAFADTQE